MELLPFEPSRPARLLPPEDLTAFIRLDYEDIEPRPVIIHPFVRDGDLVLLTGAPGQGKSTLIADLVLATCLPERIEGANKFLAGAMEVDRSVATHPSRVVLLDAENEPAEWMNFLEATARARGLELDSGTMQWVLEGVRWRRCRDYLWDDLDRVDAEIDRLIDACVDLDTRFLVIDSLHKMWTRDLNSPEWVTRGLGKLKERARAAGITIIALVHTSRDYKDKLAVNKYLPAYNSQQEKEADTIIGLRRNVKEELLDLVLVKRRAAKWNLEGSKAQVRLSSTYGGYDALLAGWVLQAPGQGKSPVAGLLAHHRKVLMALPRHRSFTYEDMEGPKQKRSGVLRPLVTMGLVEVSEGKGVRGDPYQFVLTAEGKNAIDHLRNTPGTVYFQAEGK